MKTPLFTSFTSMTFVIIMLGLSSCSPRVRPSTKLTIVASTTHIQALLTPLGGEHISSEVFVQDGMCPGHFDITPRHIVHLQQAQLFIRHGWEQWASAALSAANSPALHVVTLTTRGNPMLPAIHGSLAAEITALLCRTDPSHCTTYTASLQSYQTTLNDSVSAILSRAAVLRGVAVLCAEHHQPLLEWLGCRVIGTYGRPESMSPSQLTLLSNQAREQGVRLVVDNLQSGPDAGRALAQDIGAVQVTLSNFPLGGSYPQTLSNNITGLVQALDNGTR